MEHENSNQLSFPLRCQFVKSEVIKQGNWLSMNEITYTDPHGKKRKWEGVERTTRSDGEADAVVIIPILRRMLKYDCIVLVKQFRPPLKAYSVEFPAGLIDRGESAQECAIREMKEETGYQAIVKHSSPATSLDPGLSNSTVKIISMEIDGDDEVNFNPPTQQEESEFIEVLNIQLDRLLDTLNEMSSSGVVVHSMVYSYAIANTQASKPKHFIP